MEDWERDYIETGNRAKEFLKVGHTYRIDYGKGNLNNKRIHVRAFVDGWQVVHRQWLRRKGYWYYKVDNLYAMGLDLKMGHLKHIGKTKERK